MQENYLKKFRPGKANFMPLKLWHAQVDVLVAAANPFDRELFENLRGLTGLDIEPVLAAPADIHRAIAEVYGFRAQITEATSQMGPVVAGADVGNLEQFVDLSGIEALEASSEPVIAAVEYLLHYAFEQRASDIHVEPRREESIIRMRIDGVLHPVHRIPKAVHGAIANRFKIMSRLDIAARKPQDGRIRTARGDAEMELRVSTIPTTFGDKVVVRILDPNVLVRDLSELGFLPEERETFERWLSRPHGLVVVTGPSEVGVRVRGELADALAGCEQLLDRLLALADGLLEEAVEQQVRQRGRLRERARDIVEEVGADDAPGAPYPRNRREIQLPVILR